jgi:anti-sigma B factor antagonist
MEIKIDTLPGQVRVVRLSGRLDTHGTQAVELKFTGYVAAGKQSVVVDLSQVDTLTSLGIRMFISNAKALASVGAKIIILAPQPEVDRTLRLAGLEAFCPIVRDEGEALNLLTGARVQPSSPNTGVQERAS